MPTTTTDCPVPTYPVVSSGRIEAEMRMSEIRPRQVNGSVKYELHPQKTTQTSTPTGQQNIFKLLPSLPKKITAKLKLTSDVSL